jgi:hypothetical protein
MSINLLCLVGAETLVQHIPRDIVVLSHDDGNDGI